MEVTQLLHKPNIGQLSKPVSECFSGVRYLIVAKEREGRLP